MTLRGAFLERKYSASQRKCGAPRFQLVRTFLRRADDKGTAGPSLMPLLAVSSTTHTPPPLNSSFSYALRVVKEWAIQKRPAPSRSNSTLSDASCAGSSSTFTDYPRAIAPSERSERAPRPRAAVPPASASERAPRRAPASIPLRTATPSTPTPHTPSRSYKAASSASAHSK